MTSDWSDLGSSSQSPKASAGLHLSCHIGESKLLSRCENMQVQQKALPLYTKHFKRSVTKHPVINLNQELDFKIHYQQQCSRGRRRENWDTGDENLIPVQRCWSLPQQSAASRTALRKMGTVGGPAG